MNILLEEYKQLLLLLVKFNVNFILIGGYAVIYYGYERSTGDMDIWLKPDNDNKEKLLLALREYEIDEDSLNHIAKLDFEQIQFFYFGTRPLRIDFITKISNVSYSEAEPKVNYFPLKDKLVPIIDYHHLILSKIANGRPKDMADIDELQRINRFRKDV